MGDARWRPMPGLAQAGSQRVQDHGDVVPSISSRLSLRSASLART